MSQNTSFTKKILEVHLTLGTGKSFASAGTANTKIIRGLGCDVSITKPGLPAKNSAKIKIWGMLLADMEQLTTLAFKPLEVAKNKVAVYAGDEQHGVTLAFSGDITSAWPDFNAAPDVAFTVDAIAGYVASVTPASPLTVQGEVGLDTLMGQLAQDMGFSYTNKGVTGSLVNPAISGGPAEKAWAIARQARFELLMDDGEMVIMPRGAVRTTPSSAPVWRDNSGMKGYPSFSQTGLTARGLYEPAIMQGGCVQIESVVPKASGIWKVVSLRHKLQAHYPGAQEWHTEIETTYLQGQ